MSLASGSWRASLFASAKEWMRSIPCPRTSAGAVMDCRCSMVGASGPTIMPCRTAAISAGSDPTALSSESSGPMPDEGNRETTRETSRSAVWA
jgi:hypothetical protein